MNEAERCDRISLMHAGKVLASGTPQELVEKRGAASLEEAFIAYLQEAAGQSNEAEAPPVVHDTTHAPRQGFSLRRLFSYSRREALELRRDPVRSTLALMGTVILMLIMGYGISMDVETCALRCSTATRPSVAVRGHSTSPVPVTLSNSRRSPVMTSLIVGCVRAISRWRLRSRPISGAISRVVRLWNSASGSTERCRAVLKR